MVPGPGRPGLWRTEVDGKLHYLRGVDRYAKPLVGSGPSAIPRAAWDWLHEIEAAARRVPIASAPSCYWLCNWYLKWADGEVEAGRLSREHWQGQRSRLDLLLGWPGVKDAQADQLAVETVADFLTDVRARYSASYLAGVGRTIRTVWRWAARPVPGRSPVRLIGSNPLDGYTFPREPKGCKEYVSGDIVRGFYRWAWARARNQAPTGRRFGRLFVLALWFQRLTGARPGEAYRLRWDSWDRETGKITLAEHKTAHLGKSRVIWVTPPVARLLSVIERLPGRHDEYVFTHARGRGAIARGHLSKMAGEPWPSGSAASARLRVMREDALPRRCEACGGEGCGKCRGTGRLGVPGLQSAGPARLVAYAHRHGYASEAISSGLSVEHTAELLGNTPAVTASTYAHTIEGAAQARAVEFVRGRRGRRRKSKPADGG